MNIYYYINDGKIFFSKYIVKTDNYQNINTPFRIENDEIICNTEDELTNIKNILDKDNINYTIENVMISEETINKTKDVIYINRTEAINHIENNIEPESVKKIRLELENKDLKTKLQQTEDVLLTLMFSS